MSKYTTEVRFICENAAGLTESAGYKDINSILDSARDKIFDFDYPIFDTNYKATLENKILKHYYTREIGAESVGLWKLWLDTKMNEIMPYYNQLYTSALIEFNPMYDVDLTTNSQKIDNGNRDKTGSFSEENSYRDNGGFTQSKNSSTTGSNTQSKNNSENGTFEESLASTETKVFDGEEHSSTNGTNESSTSGTDTISSTNTEAHKNDHWDYYSDTPQGGINGLADNTYLTNARHVTDDTTGSTSGTTGTNTNSSSTEGETTSSTNATNDSTTTTTIATAKNGSDSKSSTEQIAGNNETTGTEQIAGNNNGTGSGEKSGTNESNEVIRNTEDYLHHVVGKTGGVSYSKMLKEYRDTFINIDMMIIKDLRPLFMNVW